MALHLYKDAAATDQISEGGAYSNPDEAVINGTTGGTDERQLWIKNDNAQRTYKAVGGTPAIRITAQGLVPGVTVEYARDNAGTPGTYAAQLDLPDGAYTTPVAFWRRITVAPGTPVQNVQASHQITANEFAV